MSTGKEVLDRLKAQNEEYQKANPRWRIEHFEFLFLDGEKASEEAANAIEAIIDTEQRRILKELVDALPPKAEGDE